MSKIGVFKEFDKLGRIVIPKDLRDRFFLYSSVEVIATDEGVLLKNPDYVMVKKEKLPEERK